MMPPQKTNHSMVFAAQPSAERLLLKPTPFEILAEIDRDISEATYAQEVMDLTAKHLYHKLQLSFACVFQVKDGSSLELKSAIPAQISGRTLKQVGLSVRYQACKSIMEKSAPKLLSRKTAGSNNCYGEFLQLAESLCLAPMFAGRQATGMFILGSNETRESGPFTFETLKLVQTVADHAGSAIRRTQLYTELEHSYLQTVMALANAIDAKDTYTAHHGLMLAKEAMVIGKELRLSTAEINELKFGAILHDVGKIGIPDAILQKPGKLNADEWKYMKMHPVKGEKILSAVPRLKGAAEIVRHHHEWYDGSGYPDGLAAKDIPLGARILNVVDAYHAIIDKRVYRDSQPPETAVAELKRFSGTQFDPAIVEIYLKILKKM